MKMNNETNRICELLTKKGYRYTLSNNFLENGIVITIKPNIQIEGEIIVFDNGNWYKNIYLKNTSLYKNGKIEIFEDLLNYGIYKIFGELPINI